MDRVFSFQLRPPFDPADIGQRRAIGAPQASENITTRAIMADPPQIKLSVPEKAQANAQRSGTDSHADEHAAAPADQGAVDLAPRADGDESSGSRTADSAFLSVEEMERSAATTDEPDDLGGAKYGTAPADTPTVAPTSDRSSDIAAESSSGGIAAAPSTAEIDASLSEDIDSLLQGQVDSMEGTLDDIFENASFLSEGDLAETQAAAGPTPTLEIPSHAPPDDTPQPPEKTSTDSTGPTAEIAVPAPSAQSESAPPPADVAGDEGSIDDDGEPVSIDEDSPTEDLDATTHDSSVDEPAPHRARVNLPALLLAPVRFILTLLGLPVLLVPSSKRHLVDYFAITLAIWGPIVWLISLFVL